MIFLISEQILKTFAQESITSWKSLLAFYDWYFLHHLFVKLFLEGQQMKLKDKQENGLSFPRTPSAQASG